MNPIDPNAEWLEADGLGGFASGYVWEHSGAALTFTLAAVCAAIGGLVFALGSGVRSGRQKDARVLRP